MTRFTLHFPALSHFGRAAGEPPPRTAAKPPARCCAKKAVCGIWKFSLPSRWDGPAPQARPGALQVWAAFAGCAPASAGPLLQSGKEDFDPRCMQRPVAWRGVRSIAAHAAKRAKKLFAQFGIFPCRPGGTAPRRRRAPGALQGWAAFAGRAPARAGPSLRDGKENGKWPVLRCTFRRFPPSPRGRRSAAAHGGKAVRAVLREKSCLRNSGFFLAVPEGRPRAAKRAPVRCKYGRHLQDALR